MVTDRQNRATISTGGAYGHPAIMDELVRVLIRMDMSTFVVMGFMVSPEMVVVFVQHYG
jgi:hypothetical protein